MAQQVLPPLPFEEDQTSGSVDAELVMRALHNDVDAYGALFDRHAPRVSTLAFHLVGDRTEAEDITQDAFLQALGALPTLRQPEAFGAWVARIASNIALSVLRRRSRMPQADDSDDIFESTADSARWSSPEDMGLVSEEQLSVRMTLDRLAPTHRAALTMRELGGLSYAELAQELGTTPGGVEALLFRARSRFRDEYAKVTLGATITPPATTCREAQSELTALADGELTETRRTAVVAHVRGCMSCTATLQAQRDSRRLLVLVPVAVSPALKATLAKLSAMLAAGAAAAGGLGASSTTIGVTGGSGVAGTTATAGTTAATAAGAAGSAATAAGAAAAAGVAGGAATAGVAGGAATAAGMVAAGAAGGGATAAAGIGAAAAGAALATAAGTATGLTAGAVATAGAVVANLGVAGWTGAAAAVAIAGAVAAGVVLHTASNKDRTALSRPPTATATALHVPTGIGPNVLLGPGGSLQRHHALISPTPAGTSPHKTNLQGLQILAPRNRTHAANRSGAPATASATPDAKGARGHAQLGATAIPVGAVVPGGPGGGHRATVGEGNVSNPSSGQIGRTTGRRVASSGGFSGAASPTVQAVGSATILPSQTSAATPATSSGGVATGSPPAASSTPPAPPTNTSAMGIAATAQPGGTGSGGQTGTTQVVGTPASPSPTPGVSTGAPPPPPTPLGPEVGPSGGNGSLPAPPPPFATGPVASVGYPPTTTVGGNAGGLTPSPTPGEPDSSQQPATQTIPGAIASATVLTPSLTTALTPDPSATMAPSTGPAITTTTPAAFGTTIEPISGTATAAATATDVPIAGGDSPIATPSETDVTQTGDITPVATDTATAEPASPTATDAAGDAATPTSDTGSSHNTGSQPSPTPVPVVVGDNPSLSLSTASSRAGSSILITGTGFSSFATVDVRFYCTYTMCGLGSALLATVDADAQGNFTTQVQLPQYVPAGPHLFAATDPDSGAYVWTRITVLPSPRLALSSGSGNAGDHITVSGSGFAPNASIPVRIFCTGQSCAGDTVLLGTTTTDARGSFSLPAVVPSFSAVGPHLIGATDPATGQFAFVKYGVSQQRLLQLSTASGGAGSQLTIQGSGFAPGENVQLSLYCTLTACGDGSQSLGTVQSDSTGAIDATVQIPRYSPAAVHLIGAQGLTSSVFEVAAFVVS